MPASCPNCRTHTLISTRGSSEFLLVTDENSVPFEVYRCTRCGEPTRIPLDIAKSLDKKENE